MRSNAFIGDQRRRSAPLKHIGSGLLPGIDVFKLGIPGLQLPESEVGERSASRINTPGAVPQIQRIWGPERNIASKWNRLEWAAPEEAASAGLFPGQGAPPEISMLRGNLPKAGCRARQLPSTAGGGLFCFITVGHRVRRSREPADQFAMLFSVVSKQRMDIAERRLSGTFLREYQQA